MAQFTLVIPPGGSWLNEVRQAREAARRAARRLERRPPPPKREKT